MIASIQSKAFPTQPGLGLSGRGIDLCYDKAPAIKPIADAELIDDFLTYEEDPPLESDWHVATTALLINILRDFWAERNDIYVSGNTVVHFDPNQKKGRKFRGPDLYVIKGVKDNGFRSSWTTWEENNLFPHFVMELASKSSAKFDVDGKKDVYEKELKTPEYVVYHPNTEKLSGWRLVKGRYKPIQPNKQGWLWCNEIGLWLGVSEYKFLKYRTPFNAPRFFKNNGELVITREEAEAIARRAETERADAEAKRAVVEAIARHAETERANAETERANAEAERADAAEAEIARLKALLSKKSDL